MPPARSLNATGQGDLPEGGDEALAQAVARAEEQREETTAAAAEAAEEAAAAEPEPPQEPPEEPEPQEPPEEPEQPTTTAPAEQVVVPRSAEEDRWLNICTVASAALESKTSHWAGTSDKVILAARSICIKRRFNRPQDDGAFANDGTTVSYCTVCFRRGWQLRRTLPLNLLLTWQHRTRVRFCIAFFKKHEAECDADVEWIRATFPGEMAAGRVVVGACDLETYHSSICKNAAHKLAASTVHPDNIDKHCLVNLDADNVLAPAATTAVALELRSLPPRFAFRCKGDDGGCTGRIGCWHKSWLEVGGYDETMYPSGYQDIDFYLRVGKTGGTRALKFPCGESIPNAAERKEDRGAAKIVNAICTNRETGQTMSWGQMNVSNVRHSKGLLERGIWWRHWSEAGFARPPAIDSPELFEIMNHIGGGPLYVLKVPQYHFPPPAE